MGLSEKGHGPCGPSNKIPLGRPSILATAERDFPLYLIFSLLLFTHLFLLIIKLLRRRRNVHALQRVLALLSEAVQIHSKIVVISLIAIRIRQMVRRFEQPNKDE